MKTYSQYLNIKDDINIIAKKNLGTHNIIWQYVPEGLNKDLSNIIKSCINSVSKNKGSYIHIIISNKTIEDYITLPTFSKCFLNGDSLSPSKLVFTELLKFHLLSAYGGIWCDSNIYFSAPIVEELDSYDFFAFEDEKKNKNWDISLLKIFCKSYDQILGISTKFIKVKHNTSAQMRLTNSLIIYYKSILGDHPLARMNIDNIFDEKDNYIKCPAGNFYLMSKMADKKYSNNLWDSIVRCSKIHCIEHSDKIRKNSILQHLTDLQSINTEPKKLPSKTTFCTMLFNLRKEGLNKLKGSKRDFEDFYLKSLDKVIRRHKNVSLFCDIETANFLKRQGLSPNMKIMDFTMLPLYKSRDKYLQYLEEMKRHSLNEGYLLCNVVPDEIVDYIILVLSKLEVLKWAKDNNVYNSNYFYWIDAGTYNDTYLRCWRNWDGFFDLNSKNFKCTFLSRYNKIYTSLFKIPTYEDIALIKAPFEISAAFWYIPKTKVDEFYSEYHAALSFLDSMRLITTEQGVFSTMLKMGSQHMFDFALSYNYIECMNLVSKANSSETIINDKYIFILKSTLLFLIKFFKSKTLENIIRQKVLYKPILNRIFPR